MPRFYILSGADLGSQAELADGQAIGRASDSDWVLRDASISRRHAVVEQRGSAWFLVDAGSRNGLWLGEQKRAEIELADGLELRIGDVELRVRFKSATPAASATPTAAPALDVEEIQLEELDSAPVVPAPAATLAPPSPSPKRRQEAGPARAPSAAVRPSAPATRRTAPGAVVQAERGILQYQKHAAREGLLHSDLAQQPWYVRLAWVLVALALAGLIAFFAFRATGFLKHKVQGDPELETSETR